MDSRGGFANAHCSMLMGDSAISSEQTGPSQGKAIAIFRADSLYGARLATNMDSPPESIPTLPFARLGSLVGLLQDCS